MARFKSTTFGKISGKHGSAVAAVRKDGLCILKVYRVAANPNTAGQKNQRAKFGFVMKQINCMRSVFTKNFGGQYGINKVIATAIKTAVVGEFPNYTFDYSKLFISSGGIFYASNINIKSAENDCLIVSWSVDVTTYSSSSDKVNLVFLNPETKSVVVRYECAFLSDGKVKMEVPHLWLASEIHAWMYLTSQDGKKQSISQYITTV
jgi:hypothetical protein